MEKVTKGNGGTVAELTTPENVINNLKNDPRSLNTLIVLCEWDDGESSMAYSAMSPRDLWWQLTNAVMRVWHMIGGV